MILQMSGAAEGQSGEGGVSGYSSYVITIDGISTVFSNPVRLSGSTVAAEAPDTPDQIPGAVQVRCGLVIVIISIALLSSLSLLPFSVLFLHP